MIRININKVQLIRNKTRKKTFKVRLTIALQKKKKVRLTITTHVLLRMTYHSLTFRILSKYSFFLMTL